MDKLLFQIALDISYLSSEQWRGTRSHCQGPHLAARHILWPEDVLRAQAGGLPRDHQPALLSSSDLASLGLGFPICELGM